MSIFVDQVRFTQVTSVLDFDVSKLDREGNLDNGRFARYVLDRVALAYRHPESELLVDRWDLRVLGRRGHLDFRPNPPGLAAVMAPSDGRRPPWSGSRAR